VKVFNARVIAGKFQHWLRASCPNSVTNMDEKKDVRPRWAVADTIFDPRVSPYSSKIDVDI